MTTIADLDITSDFTAGVYTSDAIALTDEAFASIQIVKDADTPPDGDLEIIPLVSNDGTTYSFIKDSEGKIVSYHVPVTSDRKKGLTETSFFFALEPVRATNLMVKVLQGAATEGVFSLYVKTSMTES